MYIEAEYSRDTFQFDGQVVPNLNFVLTKGPEEASRLGLGYRTPGDHSQTNFLDELQKKGLSSSLGYSLYFKSPDAGTILFGAIDVSRLAHPLETFLMPLDSPGRIFLDGMRFRGDTQAYELSPIRATASVRFDTELIWVSDRIFKNIQTIIKGSVYSEDGNRIILNCDLEPKLGLEILVRDHQIAIPGSALVERMPMKPAAQWPAGPSERCQLAISKISVFRGNTYTDFIFGLPFLQYAYVVFDFQNNEIGISAASEPKHAPDEGKLFEMTQESKIDEASKVLGNCRLLYGADPDIAGLWTQIVFAVHSAVFIILGGLVTPIVYFYLPKDTENYGIFDSRLAGIENSISLAESNFNPQVPIPLLEDGCDRSPISMCRCLKAIKSVYCAQCITGMAYVFISLIKRGETNAYHQAFILSILVTQSGMGSLVVFHESILHGMDKDTNTQDKFNALLNKYFGPCFRPIAYNIVLIALLLTKPGQRWSRTRIMELAYRYCMIISVSITFKKSLADPGFDECIPLWRLSTVSLPVASLMNSILANRVWKRSHLRYAICISFAISTTVGAQVWLYHLTSIFRPARMKGGSEETDFTFGQALVFFMLLPLIIDFFTGLVFDIRRIQRSSWAGEIDGASFSALWTVLIPFVCGKIRSNLEDILRRSIPAHFRMWVSDPLSNFWDWGAELCTNICSEVFRKKRNKTVRLKDGSYLGLFGGRKKDGAAQANSWASTSQKDIEAKYEKTDQTLTQVPPLPSR
ncbi:hypothetical protein TWF730_010255 [Orbilia blumenaviensis]|uniref:Peptidase A1 domain-containing protein n=1 Tax=Orbilia blumenaviensis TaxID=1796055 RepID=A0AAV9UMR0_9PEZI